MLSNLGSLQPRIVVIHFTWLSCVQCGLHCATFMPELKLSKGTAGDGAGAERAARGRALSKQRVWMGEEPGEKRFLGLKTSEGQQGERGTKSGHEPAPCSVPACSPWATFQ